MFFFGCVNGDSLASLCRSTHTQNLQHPFTVKVVVSVGWLTIITSKMSVSPNIKHWKTCCWGYQVLVDINFWYSCSLIRICIDEFISKEHFPGFCNMGGRTFFPSVGVHVRFVRCSMQILQHNSWRHVLGCFKSHNWGSSVLNPSTGRELGCMGTYNFQGSRKGSWTSNP